MKEGRSLKEVAELLQERRAARRDFTAAHGAMKYGASEDVLSLSGVGEFRMSPLAHDQMAERLEIPAKYYKRMMADDPELLETNINRWLGKTGDTKRLVRTLGGNVRAILGGTYRPLDDVDMLEAVLPAMEKSGCSVRSCDVTDTRFYLKAVANNVQFVMDDETPEEAAARLRNPGQHNRRDDVFAAGIVCSNSEVGLGGLTVEPLVWRRVCDNGLIVPEAAFRKTHVGRTTGKGGEFAYEFFRDETRLADDRALWLKVRDCVEHVFDQVNFAGIVQKMEAARKDLIEAQPVQFIEEVAEVLNLNQNEQTSVLTHLLRDGDMSRYGLMNAVTRASQDVNDYDRATEMERLGGRVLELPRTDWKRIATVH